MTFQEDFSALPVGVTFTITSPELEPFQARKESATTYVILKGGYRRVNVTEIDPQVVQSLEYSRPRVGEGATLRYPSDSYPYVITRVSDSGKTVWAKPVRPVDRTTGHEPAYFNGPWPVWSHEYTREELAELVRDGMPEVMLKVTKGGWQSKGTPYTVGKAVYHRNYAD